MVSNAKRPRKACPKCNPVFSDRHARRHLLECNVRFCDIGTATNTEPKSYEFSNYFAKRNNVEDLCEQWRTRETKEGVLYDIYDGRIWNEFNGTKYNFLLRKEIMVVF